MPLIKLCALAGLGAPLFMLFLAATASDKVQGFAIAKFIGLRGLLMLVGCFLPSLLEWLPALFPPPPLSGGKGLLAVTQYHNGQRHRRPCGSVEPVVLAENGGGAAPSQCGHRRIDRPSRPTAACLITPSPPTAFLRTYRRTPQPSPKDTRSMLLLPHQTAWRGAYLFERLLAVETRV